MRKQVYKTTETKLLYFNGYIGGEKIKVAELDHSRCCPNLCPLYSLIILIYYFLLYIYEGWLIYRMRYCSIHIMNFSLTSVSRITASTYRLYLLISKEVMGECFGKRPLGGRGVDGRMLSGGIMQICSRHEMEGSSKD
jgi:hypothetical protein